MLVDLTWDCATGSGQAAHALTPHFRAIVATDASKKQIAQARLHEQARYLVAPAERAPQPVASVDLVTIAQALHWLDLPAFYAEVRRVVRHGGVIAAWCYQLHTITPRSMPSSTDSTPTSWAPTGPRSGSSSRRDTGRLPFPFE